MKNLNLLLFALFTILIFSACEKEEDKIPRAMSIIKIELLSYPIISTNGGSWDAFDGADVFLTINEGSTADLPNNNNTVSGVEMNANGNSILFPLNNTFNISEVSMSSNWGIAAWDADGFSGSQFMGGAIFNPRDQQDGLPSYFDLNTGSISFRVHVTWNF